MDDLQREIQRLQDGRVLNPFDLSAVETVANLLVRLNQARQEIASQGFVDEGGAGVNPAVEVERKLSTELRGWVKDRPDLFGERKKARERSKPNFKVV